MRGCDKAVEGQFGFLTCCVTKEKIQTDPLATRLMTATYNAGVHRFSVFVVCWTVLLFVAGALVTSKEAALSVPDWPRSHGYWIPPLSKLQGGDFFEFSHRFVAGGLGI